MAFVRPVEKQQANRATSPGIGRPPGVTIRMVHSPGVQYSCGILVAIDADVSSGASRPVRSDVAVQYLAWVLVVATSLTGCASGGPTPQDLQSVLARQSVEFVPDGPAVSADSNPEVLGRAVRGSGLPGAAATWIYTGRLAAPMLEFLIDRPVQAVYFADVEQPLMGAPGTIVRDWVVFVDSNGNVVLTVALTDGDETARVQPAEPQPLQVSMSTPRQKAT